MKLFKSIELDGETHYQDIEELLLNYPTLDRNVVENMSIDSYLDFNTFRVRRVE